MNEHLFYTMFTQNSIRYLKKKNVHELILGEFVFFSFNILKQHFKAIATVIQKGEKKSIMLSMEPK